MLIKFFKFTVRFSRTPSIDRARSAEQPGLKVEVGPAVVAAAEELPVAKW
jgi:hypothetical protein